MEILVSDFFPKYPNLPNQTILNAYADDGDSMEQILYNKKEFFELKLTREEEKPAEEGDVLFKHQKVIVRFLSAHTDYDALFLFHEMGTGKTCAAFGVIENLRESDRRYRGALFVTRNESILNGAIAQLAQKCTYKKYLPDKPGGKFVKSVKEKLPKGFYTFLTHEKFASEIARLNDEQLVLLFSNFIIVVDEVHNIKLYGTGENVQSAAYNNLHRLLHIPKNTKKIIMTGTPMTDSAKEIAAVLNLILPLDKQFPITDAFENEFLTQNEQGFLTLRPEKVDEFKINIRGYVSYLKSALTDITTVFVGGIVPPMQHFKLFTTRMSEYQRTAYEKIFKLYSSESEPSQRKNDFYRGAEQASLFVYPDGTSGENGYKNFFLKNKLLPKFRELFVGKSIAEKLELLQKFSCIYASTIKSILENPDKNTLVYNSSVRGSGAILFSEILKLFDFESFSLEATKTPKKRFALLTAKTLVNKQELPRIQSVYNHKRNRNGGYLQVIIFSQVAAEGVSFSNVQQIHIHTPHWNYSETTQAIARGLRLNSHDDLTNEGLKVMVQVYQHCPLADESNPQTSVYFKKYATSEKKDISVKNIEHYIKEAAVDCALFYEHNKSTAEFERPCDYMPCAYTCEGISSQEKQPLDMSSYQLFYDSKDQKSIQNAILSIFKENFQISFSQLQRAKFLKKYSAFQLLSALRKIIAENVPIENAYGFTCYLRENMNVYFLLEKMHFSSDLLCASYSKFPVGVGGQTLSDSIDSFVQKNFLKQLKDSTTQEEADDIIPKFPKNWQQKLIEQALLNAEDLISQFILVYFEDSIQSDTSYIFDDKLFSFNSGSKQWEVQDVPLEVVLPTKDLHGYVGLYKEFDSLDGFKIKKVLKGSEVTDTRKISTGENCMTFKNKGNLLVRLGATIPPDDRVKLEQTIGLTALMSPSERMEKVYNYFMTNVGLSISTHFKDEGFPLDEDHILRSIYFNRRGFPAKAQCEIIYNLFKENNCLQVDVQKEGYGKKRKEEMKKLRQEMS